MIPPWKIWLPAVGTCVLAGFCVNSRALRSNTKKCSIGMSHAELPAVPRNTKACIRGVRGSTLAALKQHEMRERSASAMKGVTGTPDYAISYRHTNNEQGEWMWTKELAAACDACGEDTVWLDRLFKSQNHKPNKFWKCRGLAPYALSKVLIVPKLDKRDRSWTAAAALLRRAFNSDNLNDRVLLGALLCEFESTLLELLQLLHPSNWLWRPIWTPTQYAGYGCRMEKLNKSMEKASNQDSNVVDLDGMLRIWPLAERIIGKASKGCVMLNDHDEKLKRSMFLAYRGNKICVDMKQFVVSVRYGFSYSKTAVFGGVGGLALVNNFGRRTSPETKLLELAHSLCHTRNMEGALTATHRFSMRALEVNGAVYRVGTARSLFGYQFFWDAEGKSRKDALHAALGISSGWTSSSPKSHQHLAVELIHNAEHLGDDVESWTAPRLRMINNFPRNCSVVGGGLSCVRRGDYMRWQKDMFDGKVDYSSDDGWSECTIGKVGLMGVELDSEVSGGQEICKRQSGHDDDVVPGLELPGQGGDLVVLQRKLRNGVTEIALCRSTEGIVCHEYDRVCVRDDYRGSGLELRMPLRLIRGGWFPTRETYLVNIERACEHGKWRSLERSSFDPV